MGIHKVKLGQGEHETENHKTPQTQAWHNSPLPEGTSCTLTTSNGEGGWTEQEAREAMADPGTRPAMAEQGA